ncbi:hypothetical protein BH11BAC1_BH11BAC1_22220 [soil metagenome]
MKKLIFFLIVVTSFQHFARGQSIIADSLETVLRKTTTDSSKVALLIAICKEKWKYAEYAEAKKYADEALTLSIKIDFRNGVADAYTQIGIVFWYLKDNEQALQYHQRALRFYEETGNKKGVSEIYNRIGHDYADWPDFSKALEWFQKAMVLDSLQNNLDGVSKNLDLIGWIYMNLDDYPKALSYYFKALKIAEAIESKRGIAALGHDIGEVYEKQNNLPEALRNAMRGLSLALEIGEKHLIEEAYTGLEKIYIKMHDFKNAYATRLKYDEIEVALSTADNAGKIKQVQMRYDFANKQMSDSISIVKEIEISDLKLQKQKALTYGGLLGIAVTILLLFFVYRNYKKQRVANTNLAAAQEQLIRSEKMSAFGMMAARVAHEIQNPLNFVNNFSELSKDLVEDVITSTNELERIESAELLKKNLQKINEHGKRLNAIVEQLQDHTIKGTVHEFFEKEKHA